MMPVLYAEDGVIIDEQKRGYALYVIDNPDYGFQGLNEKARQIQAVIRGCREVIGEWHVYSLALGVSPSRWRERLAKFKNPVWKDHVEDVQGILKYRTPFERRIYLAIPLTKKEKIEFNIVNARQAAKELMEGAKQVMKHFVPFDELTLELLSRFHQEKRRWRDRFGGFVRLHVATMAEMEAWLRHGMFRGRVEPDTRIPSKLPYYVSSPSGVIHPFHPLGVWTQDAMIENETAFSLPVRYPNGTMAYQTFFAALTVPTDIPEDIPPVGYEWIYDVENLAYPVDVALHVRVEDPREAQRKLRTKKLMAEAKWKEYNENEEEVPMELEEEMASTSELGRNLRARIPLLHVKAIYGIGETTEEALHERAKQLISDLSHVQLVQAPGDQQKFWQAFYPFGADIPDAYETPMDPGIFAAGVPFASAKFGDPSGFYLGERLLDGPCL